MAWNKAMALLTGKTEENMLGCGDYGYALPFFGENRPLLIDYVLHPELAEAQKDIGIRQDCETMTAEMFSPLLRDGVGAYLWCSASLIRDVDGSVVGAISTVKDFTEYKETQRKLRYYSMYDVLTGLYNRSYFEEEIIRLNESRPSCISIIMCDVDGLKLINDSLGHHWGDELLKSTATVLQSAFHTTGVVARIGGDEFAVLLADTDQRAAAEAVTRLWLALKEYNRKEPEIPLSLSIGYATGKIPVQNVIIEADNNLNRNKLRRSNSTKSHFTATLMAMLAERDYVTEGHAERMEELAEMMSKAIGLSPSEKIDLILLAKFHDIGKVGVSDKILFKPASLTTEEMNEMKRHSEIGYRIALSSPDLSHIAKYILHHHEWWNGEGYPLGLKGEEIPLPCRILTIIDTYDAMTSDRPYRRALPAEEVLNYIHSQKGVKYDPKIVDTFLGAIRNLDSFCTRKNMT
jgi:diguanylate cyclase (GGDEF)-like protein